MPSLAPTENELLEALRAALVCTPENPKGALTLLQIREVVGISDKKARETVRQLITAGKVESTRATITTISGAMLQVPAYQLKR